VEPKSVIELVDIWKAFGPLQILSGVSISVPRGKSVVVMGGSGTGKSVLIKHIVRLLSPDRGEVWVFGKRVDLMEEDDVDRMRLSIGYLFQSGALFDSMTVIENMDFILSRHTKLTKSERRDRIDETLSWVNLVEKGLHFPSELSGGQQKRIALARAIVLEPKILLYDEPTTGLDPHSVREVSRLIVRLRDERGITSVAITHDLLCAEIIADEVHFLSDGRILASGTLDDVRLADDPEIRNFFG
jgi:phospholipid/cholesterol/gamma-HCH transport system ATP-binding protein